MQIVLLLRAIQAINLFTQFEVYLHMLRVQAYIIGQNGNVYDVEALTEGSDKPHKFSIFAKSEDDAAMEAIRRMEEMAEMLEKAVRLN